MQAIRLFIIMILLSITVSAQGITIPQEVKDSFTQLYPKATGVKWIKVDETEVYDAEYQAKFKNKGNLITVVFNTSGEFVMTKTNINKSKLPKPILTYIKDNYGGIKVVEANQLEAKSKNKFYEAIVKIGAEKLSLYFNEEGEQTDKGNIE
ncbi:MAG TPA: PepSY-like domain-containing protein [Melioribacteraceae bacterium]|nr:PepSY-like domain-containing protein [Melioribacteraceae bacterium]